MNRHTSRALRWAAVITAVAMAAGGCASVEDEPEPSGSQGPDSRWATVESMIACAEQEGTVNVDFILIPDEMNRLIADFKADYPNVGLEFRRDDSGPLRALQEQELNAGQVNFDVTMTANPIHFMDWSEDDVIVDLSDQPGYADLPDGWTREHHRSIALYSSITPPLINTDVLPADQAPKDYRDLLDPRFKGLIGVDDPTVSGVSATAWSSLYLTYGKEFVEGIAAQEPSLYRTVVDGSAGALAAGEIGLFYQVSGGSLIATVKAAGDAIKVVPVPNITPSTVEMAVPRGAAHPCAARLFLHWAVTSERAGETLKGSAKFTAATVAGVTDYGTLYPAYAGITPDMIAKPDFQKIREFQENGGLQDVADILGY